MHIYKSVCTQENFFGQVTQNWKHLLVVLKTDSTVKHGGGSIMVWASAPIDASLRVSKLKNDCKVKFAGGESNSCIFLIVPGDLVKIVVGLKFVSKVTL